jgi:dienelactone hydrolase
VFRLPAPTGPYKVGTQIRHIKDVSRLESFSDGCGSHRELVIQIWYPVDPSVGNLAKAPYRDADQQVMIRALDARFVLDTLERLNEDDPVRLLTGSLDLTRVGIFGFSLGGGTAAETCWLDRRFKAGLDMGGMVAGESAGRGTRAPFFFMFEGMYESFPYTPGADISGLNPRKRREIEFTRKQFGQMKASLSKFGGYWLAIDGIKHLEFCDSPFFSPLRRGSASPEATARIISKYVLAFFDKLLRNSEQPLLDSAPSGIPGVRFQVWGGASAGQRPRKRIVSRRRPSSPVTTPVKFDISG